MYLRIPVVIGHEAENEGQKIEFLAQSPLWSGEDNGWRSSHHPPLDYIEINTRREVTPNDERQSYSKAVAQIAAEWPGRVERRRWAAASEFHRLNGGSRPLLDIQNILPTRFQRRFWARADIAAVGVGRGRAVRFEPLRLAYVADSPDSPFRQVANLVTYHLGKIVTEKGLERDG